MVQKRRRHTAAYKFRIALEDSKIILQRFDDHTPAEERFVL